MRYWLSFQYISYQYFNSQICYFPYHIRHDTHQIRPLPMGLQQGLEVAGLDGLLQVTPDFLFTTVGVDHKLLLVIFGKDIGLSFIPVKTRQKTCTCMCRSLQIACLISLHKNFTLSLMKLKKELKSQIPKFLSSEVKISGFLKIKTYFKIFFIFGFF